MIQIPIKKQSFGIYYDSDGGVESLIFHDKEDVKKLVTMLHEALVELETRKQKDFDSKHQLALEF